MTRFARASVPARSRTAPPAVQGPGAGRVAPLALAALLAAGCGRTPLAPAPGDCTDGRQGGEETDVDCGGSVCAPCGEGRGCSAGRDCRDGLCENGRCAPATTSCHDGARDGRETDIDCGGGDCPACADGRACLGGGDCQSESCMAGRCLPPGCADGARNGAETDVDCGGPLCPPCAPERACAADRDCQSHLCKAGRCTTPYCNDGVANGDETDVDCGGQRCPPCGPGRACGGSRDCDSGVCRGGACQPPGCGDGVRNGDETDVDCGGSCPTGCGPGQRCAVAADCASRVCTSSTCQPATCFDRVRNGGESDVDCGGPCPACADGQSCAQGSDCQSLVCTAAACAAASCADQVKNGAETDVDCGGPVCPPCGPGRACAEGRDCWNQSCSGGLCGKTGKVSVGGNFGPPLRPGDAGSKYVKLDGQGRITLDLGARLASVARFLWASNSSEGTVSKVDPRRQVEVARYCTCAGCNCDPSRVSVSLDGDLLVANRAAYYYGGALHPERASLTRIAGDKSRCVDRNGNGVIDTSSSGGPVPPRFQWLAFQAASPDECVLWSTPLTRDRSGNLVGGGGTAPRAVSVDAVPRVDGSLSSNAYVGLYATREVAQIDLRNGAIRQQFDVQASPYISAYDRLGRLWVRGAENNLVKVDTTDPNLPITVYPPSPCAYAMGVDRRGYIYTSGGNCVARFNPDDPKAGWESSGALPNACFTRGMSVDNNLQAWVSDTCAGMFQVDASRDFGKGLVFKKLITPPPGYGDGNAYLGSAVDADGFPWLVMSGSGDLFTPDQQSLGQLFRIDPRNYGLVSLTIGHNPYVYSDMTGSQLAWSGPITATFNVVVTPYCGASATWQKLSWSDVTPPGSSITVKYRAARDLASLPSALVRDAGTDPGATQPVALNLNGVEPAVLEVLFVLTTSDQNSLPAIVGVTASYTCP